MLIRFVTVTALVASTLSAAGTSGAARGQQPPVKKASPPTSSSKNAAANKSAKGSKIPKGDPSLPVAYVTTGEGNVARYRVRERLAGKELDNDAIGETPKVTGSIALDKSGKIVSGQSGFTAELGQITSDQTRRDNYVRRRLLVTDSFPTTALTITEIRGLLSPLPTVGETKFQLLGDLTVKGVTRPSTWDVTATVSGSELKGSAKTRFTFADFQLTQPRVPILLSVNDTIALEYDFVMTRKAP